VQPAIHVGAVDGDPIALTATVRELAIRLGNQGVEREGHTNDPHEIRDEPRQGEHDAGIRELEYQHGDLGGRPRAEEDKDVSQARPFLQ